MKRKWEPVIQFAIKYTYIYNTTIISCYSGINLHLEDDRFDDEVAVHNHREKSFPQGRIQCQSVRCSTIVQISGNLDRRWQEYHEPRILMFMCLIEGCTSKRKSRFLLFGHLMKQKHGRLGIPFTKPEDVRIFFREFPSVCELVRNRDYMRPVLNGDVPPVPGPLPSPPHSLPFGGKFTLAEGVESFIMKCREVSPDSQLPDSKESSCEATIKLPPPPAT